MRDNGALPLLPAGQPSDRQQREGVPHLVLNGHHEDIAQSRVRRFQPVPAIGSGHYRQGSIQARDE
jgi:hypothetical protein